MQQGYFIFFFITRIALGLLLIKAILEIEPPRTRKEFIYAVFIVFLMLAPLTGDLFLCWLLWVQIRYFLK